jgi:hypothetical protein
MPAFKLINGRNRLTAWRGMSREVSPLNTYANSTSVTRVVRRSWTAWEVRSGCPTRNRFQAFSTERTPDPK